MAAPHYTPSGKPIQGSEGNSKELRDEFGLIETAMQVMNEFPETLWFVDANSDDPRYVPVPFAAKIIRVYVVISEANATTSTFFTIEIAGVLVTLDSTLEFSAAAGAGSVQSAKATALNIVTAGGSIEVISDNGGSSVMPASITLILQRT